MRKMIAAMKVSVDGKTEGPDGYADWVQAWSEDYGLTSEIDACVVGSGMYPNYEEYWTGVAAAAEAPDPTSESVPTPGEVQWSRFAAQTPHYVVTKTLTSARWANTTFVSGAADLAALKEQSGKNIYLMGGARLLASCLDGGLVDELRLIVYPLIAGEGAPLFRAPARRGLGLETVERLSDGRVSLRYVLA